MAGKGLADLEKRNKHGKLSVKVKGLAHVMRFDFAQREGIRPKYLYATERQAASLTYFHCFMKSVSKRNVPCQSSTKLVCWRLYC